MRSTLEKFGDDVVALIPETILAQIGASIGDEVSLSVDAGRIIVKRVGPDTEAGWVASALPKAPFGRDDT